MVIRVAAVDDPRLAIYRSLADPAALEAAGVFVAEGRLVVRRLIAAARFRVHSLLLTPAAHAALSDTLAQVEAPVYLVPQEVMNGIAGFNIHRGCLALAERPAPADLTSLPLADLRRLVVLEGVNNPDNVGGIFRSAAALGADAVLLGPACGDPLYRKAVRTSMAATLAVPFAGAGDWPAALRTLRGQGLRVLALTPAAGATALPDVPRDLARIALLVGAEGEGLSAAALDAADLHVRIPMRTGRAESLNVTVAASIALYHFA